MSLLQNIKQTIASKKIEKILAAQKRNVSFTDFDSVKNIIILFEADSEENNFHIKQYAAELTALGKKVFAWGFLDKKEIVSPIFPYYRLFSNKELDFYGLPSKSLENEFALLQPDLVIQLSVSDKIPLDYLLAISAAPFKASKTKPYKGISDLMITLQEPFEESFLYNQILFYLKNISAK